MTHRQFVDALAQKSQHEEEPYVETELERVQQWLLSEMQDEGGEG